MKNFNAHILVVDDDDGIRDLVKQYLDQNNFLVSTAKSAEDALEKVKIIMIHNWYHSFLYCIKTIQIPSTDKQRLRLTSLKMHRYHYILRMQKAEFRKRFLKKNFIILGCIISCGMQKIFPQEFILLHYKRRWINFQ